MRAAALLSVAALTLGTISLASRSVGAAEARPASTVQWSSLDTEIRGFLDRELTAHLAEVRTLNPPPARVHGALTTGDFSWGTFMRALAAWSEITGRREVASRDLPRLIAEMGLVEARRGGKSFSQLYASLALRHFGASLDANPVWQALTPSERKEWATLLDPTRFYDPATRELIGLPANYLGVAARIAALAREMGQAPDARLQDSLLDRAAQPFVEGALFADDGPPHGRYDRYSQEYARYVFEAAERGSRADILAALRPSLTVQMRLWWDLVQADGYGYTWGRSLGAIGHLDTLEIIAFLAAHPEFRPAPLAELAAAYHQAWRWLRADYREDRHLLSVLAPGRGNYGYITSEREWQQTTGFFGKTLPAHAALARAMAEEGVREFPEKPRLDSVARLQIFRHTPRLSAVWVVREGALAFAVPFTSGTAPALADYLPAPQGFPGLGAPVEQAWPALVPFLLLSDGRTVTASEGVDTLDVSADGRRVTAEWHRFAIVGAPRETFDGLRSRVTFTLTGRGLLREETLTATRPVRVQEWRLAAPFTGTGAPPHVTIEQSDWPLVTSEFRPGDGPLGKGARGALARHTVWTSSGFLLEPGRPQSWTLSLSLPPGPRPKDARR